MVVLHTESIELYFQQALEESLKEQNIELSDAACYYIVHLLTSFSRSEYAFAGSEHNEKQAFISMLSRASETSLEEALRIYKHVGDMTLYRTGFFSESVKNQLVSPQYYMQIGESAYSSASSLSRSNAALNSVIFAELADRFTALVHLLKSIRLFGHKDQDMQHRSSQTFEIIELYQKSGDDNLLRFLQDRGVFITDDADKTIH
jgi:hypothetical protein